MGKFPGSPSQVPKYVKGVVSHLRKAEGGSLAYWDKHGIEVETLERFGIGWDPQELCYVVPVSDVVGAAISVHLLWPGRDKDRKWRTPDGLKTDLFPRSRIRTKEAIVLCEGESDCLLLRQMGINAVTTTGGACSLRKDQAEFLVATAYGEPVHLLYDNEPMGQQGRRRSGTLLRQLGADVRDVALPKEYKDLCEYVLNGHTVTDVELLLKGSRNVEVGIGLVDDWSVMPDLDEDIIPEDGWLADYVTWAVPQTDAPIAFHLFVGLTILSTVMQRRIMIPRGSSPVFPNIYTCILAESTQARKTTSCNIGLSLLSKISGKREIVAGQGTIESEPLLMPSEMTPESLLDELTRRPFGLLYWKELAAVFNQVAKKSYMSGYDDIVHIMYDNPEEHIIGRRGTRWEIFNPTLTLLATGQPSYIAEATEERWIASGFLPRILWVCGKAQPWKWPGTRNVKTADDLIATLRGLWDEFPQLDDGQGAVVTFEDFVGVEAWCYDWHQRASTVDEVRLQPFYQRTEEHVLKLAMLMQMAEDGSTVISTDNFLRSTLLADFCVTGAELVVRTAGSSHFEKLRTRILRTLHHRKGKATLRDILRAIHCKKDDLLTVVDTLKAEGAVIDVEIFGERKARTPRAQKGIQVSDYQTGEQNRYDYE